MRSRARPRCHCEGVALGVAVGVVIGVAVAVGVGLGPGLQKISIEATGTPVTS
jgi:hypothetical protein